MTRFIKYNLPLSLYSRATAEKKTEYACIDTLGLQSRQNWHQYEDDDENEYEKDEGGDKNENGDEADGSEAENDNENEHSSL